MKKGTLEFGCFNDVFFFYDWEGNNKRRLMLSLTEHVLLVSKCFS